MCDEKFVLVHSEPTDDELRRCFRFLSEHGGFGRVDRRIWKTENFFVSYMRDPYRLCFVGEMDGNCAGIMWLDCYKPARRTAFVHYAVSRRMVVQMVRAAEFVLRRMIKIPEYDLFYADVCSGDELSRKLAGMIGFKQLIRAANGAELWALVDGE